MNKKLIGIVFILLLIAGIGFFLKSGVWQQSGQNTQQSANHKVQAVASFYPLYYFASQIGGDKAVVMNITPAGAEPHDYEPSTQDVARIEKSNLLILNGGKLEAWGDKIRDTLKGSLVQIVIAGESLANQQVNEDGHMIQDPHVWLSPPLAAEEARVILEGFTRADPANSAYYQANYQHLLDRLTQLNKQYNTVLPTCRDKNIVTSHAAFGYLAKAYGLTQVPIAGLSPDAEPSSQQLVAIANFAKQNNVRYIFFESLVSPKLAQTIAQEVGAQTLVLDPIEGLSDDDIRQGKDYFSQMQMNLTNLKTALQCQ